MMSASNEECISMNLFAVDHDKNSMYSFETGGWGDMIRLFPGDFREEVGPNDDDWDTVRIELTDDRVYFYLNGVLEYEVADDSLTTGTLQFVAGCVAMKVRNPRVVSGGGCSIAEPTTAPTAAPTTAPTAAPTTAPTTSPTAAPSSSPTPQCDVAEMHGVNWHDLGLLPCKLWFKYH